MCITRLIHDVKDYINKFRLVRNTEYHHNSKALESLFSSNNLRLLFPAGLYQSLVHSFK